MTNRSSVRQRVLRIAKDEFLKHGFYKISMDRLVSKLRTSKSSLYNHFDSKDSLVEEVLNEVNQEINQELKKIVDNKTLSFEDKLIQISTFTVQILERVSKEFLSDLEIHTPILWDRYQEMRKERINNYYKRLFEQGKQEGLIRDDVNIELILNVYLSITEIPLRYENVNQIKIPHQKIYEDAVSIFLNGVRK